MYGDQLGRDSMKKYISRRAQIIPKICGGLALIVLIPQIYYYYKVLKNEDN